MYRELKALLEAKTQNGDDGQDLVEGAIKALREFVVESCGVTPVEDELARLSKLLTDGEVP